MTMMTMIMTMIMMTSVSPEVAELRRSGDEDDYDGDDENVEEKW